MCIRKKREHHNALCTALPASPSHTHLFLASHQVDSGSNVLMFKAQRAKWTLQSRAKLGHGLGEVRGALWVCKEEQTNCFTRFFMRKSYCTNFYTTVCSFDMERPIRSQLCVESKKTELLEIISQRLLAEVVVFIGVGVGSKLVCQNWIRSLVFYGETTAFSNNKRVFQSKEAASRKVER